MQGAYRTRDKDLIRALARDLEQKDPWVLLSRPVQTASDDFVEQSLSERASERRARKVAYILLGSSPAQRRALPAVRRRHQLAVAAAAAVLCMGAPLPRCWCPAGGAAAAKSGCRCGRCGARLGSH